ncbi:hypothetical protein FRC08_014754 [Ceratobasidium sp. 394]|nr:hypothetical protein FRC08_014754 [Ceratobasidium sp. 394]
MSSTRPRFGRQETVPSYYFHAAGSDTDDDDNHTPPAPVPRPPRAVPPANRRLAIVELDTKESERPRRFDRSRLALVAPPDTAPPGSKPTSGSTSPRDVGIVGGSFAALMDKPPVSSVAPLPVFQSSERATTPQLTPAIGESKQIGVKVAPPIMTRLGSQDNWLPPSPTKPAPPPAGPRGAPPPRPPRLHSPPPRAKQNGSPAMSLQSLASAVSPPGEQTRLAPGGAQLTRGGSDYSIVAVSDTSNSE